MLNVGLQEALPLLIGSGRRNIHLVPEEGIIAGSQSGRHRVNFNNRIKTSLYEKVVDVVELCPPVDNLAVRQFVHHGHIIMKRGMKTNIAVTKLFL